jgi:hypothetical protein
MLIFAGLVLAGKAAAQDPAPSPQAQSPDSSKPSAPEPNTRKASDPPAQNAGQDTTGKSKIEKETGTVNDRIFEVMPNYTVENQNSAPPLSSGSKFRLATASVFDWFAYPFNMALAGIDQANNSPKSWGQGWGAYGKRVGENFADNSIGTYMTVAILPSILHEDPRYYQMAKGSFKRRAWHAADRLFVTRKDSGGHEINYSELVGNAAAAAFSNVYHPAEDRTASRNLETYGMLIFWDGVSNELKEFWPDIRRKVFHKKNP